MHFIDPEIDQNKLCLC